MLEMQSPSFLIMSFFWLKYIVIHNLWNMVMLHAHMTLDSHNQWNHITKGTRLKSPHSQRPKETSMYTLSYHYFMSIHQFKKLIWGTCNKNIPKGDCCLSLPWLTISVAKHLQDRNVDSLSSWISLMKYCTFTVSTLTITFNCETLV